MWRWVVNTGHVEGWEGPTGPGAPWTGVNSLSSVLPPPIYSHFLDLSTLGLGPHHVSASEKSFHFPIWLLLCVFWDMGLSTFTCHLYNHISLHLLILGETYISIMFYGNLRDFLFFNTQKISIGSYEMEIKNGYSIHHLKLEAPNLKNFFKWASFIYLLLVVLYSFWDFSFQPKITPGPLTVRAHSPKCWATREFPWNLKK